MASAIPKVDFDQFKVKNANFRLAFEDLCYHLFCREFGAASGVRADFNEAGLETKPILYKGKHYGYQAKFFDPQIDYGQIEHSVDKALQYFKGSLDVIHVYLNRPMGLEAKAPKKIESKAAAAGVTIAWRVPTHFSASLIKPENLDLTQLYFGHGDEFGFFKSNCDPDTTTLILSSTHLSIPLKGHAGKSPAEVLKSSAKASLIIGQPGAGKSILMHELLLGFGHVRSTDLKAMRAALVKAKALPMLVNLKDCVADTAENLIRNRQQDYGVRQSKSGFVYLFDGLDELSSEKADAALSYLKSLSKAETTERIIISCRSANPSRYLFGAYFPKAQHLELDSLTPSHAEDYFKKRDGGAKLPLFSDLKAKAPEFLDEIKDVFLVSLLWDTIERLGRKPAILDLFRQKVTLLLDEPRFKKNIEELNLLDPKKDAILALNEGISFDFQKRFQYRFTRDKLQRLILNKFPRLSYKDTNAIIAYLCSQFFASAEPASSGQDSFIYQHRRYQEYFVARKLKSEYRANRRIIRDDFLSNGDFLQGVFLPFLRQEYERDGDLAGVLELNLIDVYIGKHPGFGADEPGYSLSSSFVPAILAQEPGLYDQIMSDDNLQLTKKVAATPENVVLLWLAGKKAHAKELLEALEQRVKEGLAKERSENVNSVSEDLWHQEENWYSIRLMIDNEPLVPAFKRLARDRYERLSPESRFPGELSRRDEVVRAFMRGALRHRRKDLEKELGHFDDSENLALLEELAQVEFLPCFFESPSLMKHAKKVLAKLPAATATHVHAVVFFRAVLGLSLSEADRNLAKEQASKLWKTRPLDLHLHGGVHEHALLVYALGEHRFASILRRDRQAEFGHGYFVDLELYAALVAEFVAMLQGKRRLQQVIRAYRTYLATHERAGRAEFQWQMSQLLVRMFVEAKSAPETLLAMKRSILSDDSDISQVAFLRSLRLLDRPLFDRLVNEQEIEAIGQDQSSRARETSDVVTDHFDQAILLSSLNPERAVFHISKGINEGILRHGWRKDVIVSSLLIDALEILWRNNWAPRDQLEKYARQVFDLTKKVVAITDGKGTWRGPNSLLAMVAKYDLKLAEEFQKKIGDDAYARHRRNYALRDILSTKVRSGMSPEEIEKEMARFGKDYDYEGKPRSGYFEDRLRVYLAVCDDEIFTPSEKRQAFLKAHALLEEARKEGVTYFSDLRDGERTQYATLCKKFHKRLNLPKETSTSTVKRPRIFMTERQFVQKVRGAPSKQDLEPLFKQLATYETRIAVKGKESWDTIVRETFRLDPDLGPLLTYLKGMHYPHTSWYSENSHHLHFALAAALRDAETRAPMLRYLYAESGYEGFLGTMLALEVNRDKQGCVRLFAEFIAFCDFLVN